MASRGSQQWMFKYWGQPGWYDMETYTLAPGVKVSTKSVAKPAFLRLAASMAKYGYVIRPNATGSYNKRRITGGSGWSNHSWGTAIDINWDTNPYGKRLITDMPAAMIAEIKAIKTVEGVTVFRWGGDYSRNKDAMHFEVMATPEELRKGLAGEVNDSGVNKNNKDEEKTNTEDSEIMKKGASGNYVRQVQRLCNGVIARSTEQGWTDANVSTISVDGVYGDRTVNAVAHVMGRAQTLLGVNFDGDWTADEVTPAMVALLAQAVTRLGNGGK